MLNLLSSKKPLFTLNSLMFASLIRFSLIFVPQTSQAKQALSKKPKPPICVYIASYAPGYSWQDGIEQALTKTLKNHCQLKTFFMNSKKVFDKQALQKIGLHAVDFIESHSPDIVIVSDDNAVKYVLKEHFHNSQLPFVYCGVNNSGIPYGLPYKNTTGMIEKNPTEALLKLLFSINPIKTHVAFMTTSGTSANRDIHEFHQLVDKLGIASSAFQIHDEQEWRVLYKQLQEDPKVDIILFSNRIALKTWDHYKNIEWIKQHNNKISITTQDWMMPYVAVGMNKIPGEQGHWAGAAAIEILNGTPVSQISIVPNQKFQLWINHLIDNLFKEQLLENIF